MSHTLVKVVEIIEILMPKHFAILYNFINFLYFLFSEDIDLINKRLK